MDHAWQANASPTPWEPPVSFSMGYPRDADVLRGALPTRPGLWWFHAMGEEIRAVITAAGLVPDPFNTMQFTQAIQLLAGAPVFVNFLATPLSGYTPMSVAFTDTSTAATTSWLWTFGDGGTSTLQNPVYVYSAAGVFDVTLIANAGGIAYTVTKPQEIVVTVPPSAIWVATDNQSSPVLFSNAQKTATMNNSNGGAFNAVVVSNAGRNAGNLYFEVLLGGTNYVSSFPYQPSVGISNLDPATVSYPLGGTVSTSWVYGSNGSLDNLGVSIQTGMSIFNAGQVVMFALNLSALKFWVGLNGAWQLGGNPAANTGSLATLTAGATYRPLFSSNNNATGQSATLRSRLNEFTYAPPSGFSAWSP